MSEVINYRNVHKSDHLGVVDLEEAAENGTRPILTIQRVEQFAGNNKVSVAGRKINANIAHFVEDVKPLVINATNGAILKGFADSVDINKWAGLVIELYADKNVQMKGQTVGGIRICKEQPKGLDVLSNKHHQWQQAIDKVKAGMKIEGVREFFVCTDETYKELQNV